MKVKHFCLSFPKVHSLFYIYPLDVGMFTDLGLATAWEGLLAMHKRAVYVPTSIANDVELPYFIFLRSAKQGSTRDTANHPSPKGHPLPYLNTWPRRNYIDALQQRSLFWRSLQSFVPTLSNLSSQHRYDMCGRPILRSGSLLSVEGRAAGH